MRELAAAIAPLEEVLRNKFIPALFGDKAPISDLERALYALPARFGGLSIGNPAAFAITPAAQLSQESAIAVTRRAPPDIPAR